MSGPDEARQPRALVVEDEEHLARLVTDYPAHPRYAPAVRGVGYLMGPGGAGPGT